MYVGWGENCFKLNILAFSEVSVWILMAFALQGANPKPTEGFLCSQQDQAQPDVLHVHMAG